jgi:hypothetical protein
VTAAPLLRAFMDNKIQTIRFNLVKDEILDIPLLIVMLETPRADGQQHVVILNHFRGNIAQQLLNAIKQVFLMIFKFNPLLKLSTIVLM